MEKYAVWGTRANSPRIKFAECDTREMAELVAAAINSYKPAPVQEEATNHVFTDTFNLDPVPAKVVWKAEEKA